MRNIRFQVWNVDQARPIGKPIESKRAAFRSASSLERAFPSRHYTVLTCDA